MGRNWWMKLDKGNWKGDPKLSRCSPSTRGFWMDLLVVMDDEETDRMAGTTLQFARCCRCSEAEAREALTELRTTGTADVSNEGETWLVVSRRRTREMEISQVRSNAVQERYKTPTKEVQTRCISLNSSSCSCSVCKGEVQERGPSHYDLELVYSDYRRKVAKGSVIKTTPGRGSYAAGKSIAIVESSGPKKH